MPYGSILKTTLEHVRKRAQEEGIQIDSLGLKKFDHSQACLEQHSFSDCICAGTDDTYQISVIFGGALDEEFTLVTEKHLAIKVVDWIAEECRTESDKQSGETFDIILSEVAYEDAGTVLYRLDDQSNRPDERDDFYV